MTGWRIRVGRTVGAPAAVVWPHLVTPARYSVWACPGVDHYDVRFEPREGGPYVEEYRDGNREGRGAARAWRTGRSVTAVFPSGDARHAEAAAADAAGDATEADNPQPVTPRALARRAERRERLAAARDRLAAEDKERRDAQRAKQETWDSAAVDGRRRAGRRPADEPASGPA